MDNKITLVTAFFNVGRDKLDNQKRSDELYLSYFKFWARMKNMLYIYTSKDMENEIIKIRESFGLKDRTKVIIVDDLYKIEENILVKMERVEKQNEFVSVRMRTSDISNNAKYDYLMLMKYWFMKDVAERYDCADRVAWIDFGFNHGGAVFSNSEEFAFEWNWDFPDKIVLFARNNPDMECGILKFMAMGDSIMGPLVIAPKDKCGDLYSMMLEAMEALLMLDCYDDDQMLLEMAYKRHKDLFEIIYTEWFLALKICGNPLLSVVEREQVVEPKKRINCIGRLKKMIKIVFKMDYPKEIRELARRFETAIALEIKKEV